MTVAAALLASGIGGAIVALLIVQYGLWLKRHD